MEVIFYTVCLSVSMTHKCQLSLTNSRDALYHGKRVGNKGGRSL